MWSHSILRTTLSGTRAYKSQNWIRENYSGVHRILIWVKYINEHYIEHWNHHRLYTAILNALSYDLAPPINPEAWIKTMSTIPIYFKVSYLKFLAIVLNLLFLSITIITEFLIQNYLNWFQWPILSNLHLNQDKVQTLFLLQFSFLFQFHINEISKEEIY